MSTPQDILDTPEAGPTAIRGAAVRIAGYGIAVVMSVASAALVLRYLGAERFGQYTTIFSLIAIVMGLTDAGTTNIGVREHAVRQADERRRMLANLQGLRLALSGVGVVLALGFALVAPYNEQMVLGTVLAGFGLIITVLALTLAIPLQAELKLVQVTALEFVRQAAQVGVLIVLVVAGAGVAVLLGAPILGGLVLLGATLWVVRAHTSLAFAFDRHEWAALLRDTLAYAAASAIGVLYAYVTILVMSLVTGDAETGYFGAAHRVWYVLTTIPGLIVGSAFPVLARAAANDHDRLKYAMQRLFEMQAVVGCGLALVVAAGAPVAIDVVAGSEYDPAVPVLRLLGVALLGTAFIALGGYALLSLRLHKTLLVANAIALLTTTGLSAVLAASDGATGAAIAVIVGEIVLATIYMSALVRAGIRLRPGRVPRTLLAAGLGAIPGFAFGWAAIPAAAAAAVVFAVAVVVLRGVPPEAFEAFSALRPGRAARRTPPPSDPS